jgi:hypothetical protein
MRRFDAFGSPISIGLEEIYKVRGPSMLPQHVIAMLFNVLLPAAFAVSVVSAQAPGLTVQTKQGAVVGTLVSGTVRQFLGIPYAVANRWDPPRPPPNRKARFQATKFGNSCHQAFNAYIDKVVEVARLGGEPVVESEDCLSVNVWAPSADKTQKTSVMVFVYGGNFVVGTVGPFSFRESSIE